MTFLEKVYNIWIDLDNNLPEKDTPSSFLRKLVKNGDEEKLEKFFNKLRLDIVTVEDTAKFKFIQGQILAVVESIDLIPDNLTSVFSFVHYVMNTGEKVESFSPFNFVLEEVELNFYADDIYAVTPEESELGVEFITADFVQIVQKISDNMVYVPAYYTYDSPVDIELTDSPFHQRVAKALKTKAFTKSLPLFVLNEDSDFVLPNTKPYRKSHRYVLQDFAVPIKTI